MTEKVRGRRTFSVIGVGTAAKALLGGFWMAQAHSLLTSFRDRLHELPRLAVLRGAGPLGAYFRPVPLPIRRPANARRRMGLLDRER